MHCIPKTESPDELLPVVAIAPHIYTRRTNNQVLWQLVQDQQRTIDRLTSAFTELTQTVNGVQQTVNSIADMVRERLPLVPMGAPPPAPPVHVGVGGGQMVPIQQAPAAFAANYQPIGLMGDVGQGQQVGQHGHGNDY